MKNRRHHTKVANYKLFLLVLMLATCMVGCRRPSNQAHNLEKPARSNSTTAEAPYFKTSFQDESQFIVESILTDVTEMACFAKTHTVPNGLSVDAEEAAASVLDAPTYHVTIRVPGKTLNSDLHIDRPIWAPEVYTDIGRSVFNALQLKNEAAPADKAADTDFIKSLLELTAVNIESENEKLSAELERKFTDPKLHERAAMLLGAFALRETPDWFSDVREPLCRMTAHLAMAQLLANGSAYSSSGTVADALSYTLMDNQIDAVAKARMFDTNQPGLAAWSRIIYARNTKDYRPLEVTSGRSLAETFEYFRATCLCLYPEQAWEALPDTIKTNYTDPCRILGTTEESIELGHVLWHIHVPLVLKEFRSVYEMVRPASVRKDSLADLLNAPPERCLTQERDATTRVHVIGWGQWAAYFQAHLCNAISDNFNFLQNRYGSPETAADYISNYDKTLSGLNLYPFLRRADCTNEATYKASIDQCYPASEKAPQLFSAYAWNLICYPVDFAEFYQPYPSPHINDWFKHNPPPDTAYDSEWRREQPNILDRPDAIQHLEWMHEKAPYSWWPVGALLRVKFKDSPTFEQEEALLRPVLDYDARSMSKLAGQIENNPVAYEKLMLQAAGHIPCAYLYLGHYFAQRGQDAKAIQYLKKGMDFDRDAVRAASYAGELMKLYLKQGRKPAAAELVGRAAEVYSYDGLKSKADYLEAEGRYGEAVKIYDDIEASYGPQKETLKFLMRANAKLGDATFDHVIKSHMTSFFPDGIENVTLSSFTGPPTDGVLISEVNAETAKANLSRGTIIVALNGIRVHNFDQYTYARDVLKASELNLIVWQNEQYRQITANPPNRKFGVRMPDFKGNQ